MELAANLLAKAQSTDFDAEAVALVEKSYVLLAKVITAFEMRQIPPIPECDGVSAATFAIDAPLAVLAYSVHRVETQTPRSAIAK